MKYLRQLEPNQLKNKTCLLRIDLNIEIEKKEAFRIWAVLPTIKFLTEAGARLVILSHRGRPLKAGTEAERNKLTLKPFVKMISGFLKKKIQFINFRTDGAFLLKVEDIARIKEASAGEIFLLENLRFVPDEEKNDGKFAEFLASLGDIYINDAFAVSHRENASVAAITQFLPSYGGLVMEKEIENLDWLMKFSKKPLVVILGGAKVSDKIGLINNFSKRADYFLIGGAMANTFFASQGLPVGDSFYEKDVDLRGLMSELGRQIILPEDTVIYERKILDIGPKTVKQFQGVIGNAKTIIWNGPMGFIEKEKFTKGTKEICRAIFELADKNKEVRIVIGGGETIMSLKLKNYSSQITGKNNNIFLSTGGGAMMEYLAGKELPGIAALK